MHHGLPGRSGKHRGSPEHLLPLSLHVGIDLVDPVLRRCFNGSGILRAGDRDPPGLLHGEIHRLVPVLEIEGLRAVVDYAFRPVGEIAEGRAYGHLDHLRHRTGYRAYGIAHVVILRQDQLSGEEIGDLRQPCSHRCAYPDHGHPQFPPSAAIPSADRILDRQKVVFRQVLLPGPGPGHMVHDASADLAHYLVLGFPDEFGNLLPDRMCQQ